MTGDYLIIESIGNGTIRISYGDSVERYIGFSLKEAEAQFRQEHGLKGKKLRKICT